MDFKAPRVNWELTNGNAGTRETGDGVLFNRGRLETSRQSGGVIGVSETVRKDQSNAVCLLLVPSPGRPDSLGKWAIVKLPRSSVSEALVLVIPV